MENNFLVTEEKITHKAITKEFYINITLLPELGSVKVIKWMRYDEYHDTMDDGDTEIIDEEKVQEAFEEAGLDYDEFWDFVSNLSINE